MNTGARGPELFLYGIRWLLVAGLGWLLWWQPHLLGPGSSWLLLLGALAVQLFSHLGYPRQAINRLVLFLLLDILLWNGLVMVSGGASNPFSALLLIPIVLAFMLLPAWQGWLILMVSLVCQLAQLNFVPGDGHSHASMGGHYTGMVVGFVIAAVLLAITLHNLRRRLRQRDRDNQVLRETQLRDEQLLAIGTAAAQLTHEVATPVQSIKLLLEELEEQRPGESVVVSAQQQLQRVEQLLNDWRGIAEDVRLGRQRCFSVMEVLDSVQQLLLITRPGCRVEWRRNAGEQSARVEADPTLVPAILSLVHNALDATLRNGGDTIDVVSELEAGQWLLAIHDQGEGLTPELQQRLGSEFIDSDAGFGMGARLSYATLERFGGRVYWHAELRGACTRLQLPLSDL